MAGQEAVEAILAGMTPLWEPGAVYELRVPKTRGRSGTVSGYFDDPRRFAEAAAAWSGRAPGVYFTINPTAPELLARRANRAEERADSTTIDRDIARRRWIPIDIDPERPAGISSSDAEHDEAISRGIAIGKYLLDLGVPRAALVFGDSGNGAHIMIRIDLPNDAEIEELVKRCLQALDAKFSDDAAKVDLTTSNASRIWKVPGTIAAKGDDTPERPHRIARLLQAPVTIEVAPIDVLQELAALAPQPQAATHAQATTRGEFDFEGWVQRYLGHVAMPPEPYEGGIRIKLRECVFNPDHRGGSAALFRLASGALVYKCQHNSCAGKQWSDVRERLDPRPIRPATMAPGKSGAPPAWGAPGPERTEMEQIVFSLRDLLKKELPKARWAIADLLPEGLTMIAGKAKMGKSWLCMGLALSIADGGRALGQIPVEKGSVLYLALEDNERRLQARYQQLVEAEEAPDNLYMSLNWPRVDEGGIDQLDAWMQTHADTRLIIIDTLKRIRPIVLGTRSVYDVDYEALQGLQGLAAKYHVAIVLVHHLRKMFADDPLDAISGSTGLSASADGIWVLQRTRGEHDAMLYVVHREGEDQELALSWDPSLAMWSLAGTAEEYQLSKERQAIVQAILDAGEPQTPKEVSGAIEKNYYSTKTTMRRMTEAGILTNLAGGKYKVAPQHPGHSARNTESEIGEPRNPIVDFPQEQAKRRGSPNAPACNPGLHGVHPGFTPENPDIPQQEAKSEASGYGVHEIDHFFEQPGGDGEDLI